MEKKYCTAVVLAGGSGKRMGTKVHKQYLMLKGYPVLYYSLKAFHVEYFCKNWACLGLAKKA